MFDEGPTSFMGIEGQPLIVTLTARGNPEQITYSWTKDGRALTGNDIRVVIDGSSINITRLRKEDGGIYICEAGNNQGKTNFELNITVQCKKFINIVDI